MSLALDLHGHYWTIAPWISHVVRPRPVPSGSHLRVTVDDPAAGKIHIHGRLRDREGAGSLLVIVHGLGGSIDSHYVGVAAAAAERAGIAHLRLNMRGADGQGTDFYHAGLYSDLHAALSSPDLARFERVYIMGYSLGGHVSLRYASFEGRDARVRGVVAICPPLDLDRGAADIDTPERWVYRRHVLEGLKEMYAGIAARRPVPISAREARGIRTLRGWDHRVVAPRYGFRSAEHYYAEESAGPRLRHINVPTLLLATEADPMVLAGTLRGAINDASPLLDVRWLGTGGHVGFPEAIDLGLGSGERGLEAQAIDWLLRH